MKGRTIVSEDESKPRGGEKPRGGGDQGDSGAGQVQAAFDEAADKGYFGSSPDETPRENYTLKGVGSGAATPETERGK